MPDPFDFHQIHLGVRPTRAAVRMGSYAGWEHSALRILEFLSVTWGGAGDIVVASNDDGLAHDQLWSAVALYDPDVWANYVPTYRAFQLKDPERYARFLDAEADRLRHEHGGDLDDRRAQLHDSLMRDGSLTDWEPPAAFWERARTHLAPSWDRKYGHAETVRADELPEGLFVDVTHLSPLPERVVVPKTDNLPVAVRLLIAAKWGVLSPSGRARLEERSVAIQDLPIVDSDVPRILSACWGGPSWLTPNLRHGLAEALGVAENDQPELVDLTPLDEHGPFKMSMLGLGRFMRPVPTRHDWPLAVVVGDSADDFALAVALDRCMSPSLWVPPTILGEDTLQVVASALMSPRTRNDRDRTVHVTSCSLGQVGLERIASQLADNVYDGHDRVQISLPVALPRHRPLSVMDVHLPSTVEDELFVGDTTGPGIRARLPSGVAAKEPFHLSWWNDVVRFDHQLPSRWPLNEHLVARSGAWRSRARVTREGLAFHSHPLGFISGSHRLEQVVDNPRLRFLGAKAIFEVLAAEKNLTLMESPAGRYTARTTDLWGGLPALTTDLQRPVVRSVLDSFQSTKDSGVEPGNYLLDRRFLTFDDLLAVTGDREGLRTFVDRCLHGGLLRRGLSLACDRCRHFGWYDAEDVGQQFRCWRCRTRNVIDSEVIRGGGNEPNWYYALAEVVFQACRANFNVPVLALHQFAGQARSVLAMTDHEVVFADERVEIDLWSVVDGRIVLGEAKLGKQLGASVGERCKKARRLRRAADALTADTLLLATAASSWSPSSIATIEEAFAGSRCEIDVCVRVDPHVVETG